MKISSKASQDQLIAQNCSRQFNSYETKQNNYKEPQNNKEMSMNQIEKPTKFTHKAFKK